MYASFQKMLWTGVLWRTRERREMCWSINCLGIRVSLARTADLVCWQQDSPEINVITLTLLGIRASVWAYTGDEITRNKQECWGWWIYFRNVPNTSNWGLKLTQAPLSALVSFVFALVGRTTTNHNLPLKKKKSEVSFGKKEEEKKEKSQLWLKPLASQEKADDFSWSVSFPPFKYRPRAWWDMQSPKSTTGSPPLHMGLVTQHM